MTATLTSNHKNSTTANCAQHAHKLSETCRIKTRDGTKAAIFRTGPVAGDIRRTRRSTVSLKVVKVVSACCVLQLRAIDA
eukprot:g56782.t1